MISVILPTLNEKDNIINLINSVESVLKGRIFEIIVVDDDSIDGTWTLVEERSNADPLVCLIHRTSGACLTSALWEGIEESNGDILVWMDADFSMPPEKIPALVSEVERGADMAVGSRFVEGGSDERGPEYRLQMFLSRAFYWLSSIFLDSSFRDYTSGFIAIRADVVKDLGLRGNYGEYFIDLIYRAILRGYSFVEIPYVLTPRAYGESKTATSFYGYFKCGWKYLRTLVRLRLSA